jgi:hypothetical protein
MRCRLILAVAVAVSMVSMTSVQAADLLDKVMAVSYESGCGAAPCAPACGVEATCGAAPCVKSCCTPCRVKVCKPVRCCKPACGAEPTCGAAVAPACGAEPSCGAAPTCCVERCRPCLLEKAACRVRCAADRVRCKLQDLCDAVKCRLARPCCCEPTCGAAPTCGG